MTPKLDQLRQFIGLKAMNQRGNQTVGGEELRKMKFFIDKIPDPELRNRVERELQLQPKYAAMNLLLHPEHPLMQRFQELGRTLVYSGCDVDYEMENMKPPA